MLEFELENIINEHEPDACHKEKNLKLIKIIVEKYDL
jgi:hypothetical protein